MITDIKYCKRCKKPYDYPRCPYCNWTEEQKEVENGDKER